jgi:hypothetical protein
MLRKITFALVAAAALGTAALAPTSASAWGHGRGVHVGRYHGGWVHRGFGSGHRDYYHPRRCR